MPDPSSLALFLTAALILLVVPGPAVLYIVARSLEQGRVAGLVSTAGIGLGGVVHVTAAALGLSALVVQSAIAFSVIRYLGAAYLVYLGVRTLLARAEDHGSRTIKPRALRRLFLQGFVVNLLNPKAALFFLAFLPQFVVPEKGNVLGQVLFLGGLFVTLAVVTDSTYALLAGTVRRHLSVSRRAARFRRSLSGLTYIGLGILAALSSGKD